MCVCVHECACVYVSDHVHFWSCITKRKKEKEKKKEMKKEKEKERER